MSHQLHPATSLVCLATAALLGGMSLYAEPRAVDIHDHIVDANKMVTAPATSKQSLPVAMPSKPITSPDVSQPAAECPEYARAIEDSMFHRTLVVLSFVGCPACVTLDADLKAAGVPFAEVSRERHPRTWNAYRPALCPTWYVFRNRQIVASGAGSQPAEFFKKILAEETP